MKQRLLKQSRRLTLTLLMMLLTTATAWAKSIRYIDADGKEQTAHNPRLLTEYNANNLTDGWYFVGSNIRIDCLTIKGDVNIILMDGKSLEIRSEKYSPIMLGDGKLTIYGERKGTGKLDVTYSELIPNLAVNTTSLDSRITINGGNVTFKCEYGRGIMGITCGHVVVNGGTLTCTGNYTGILGYCDVTINGGKVNATGNKTGIASYNLFLYGSEVGDKTITLGCKNATDTIKADNYDGNVIVKKGQALTDGTDYYYGTISDPSVLAGKKLTAAESVPLTESNALQAMTAIVGMGEIPFSFTRTFKAGTPSTFCLPFSFTPNETTQGMVYNFGGVENWRVQMNRLKPENSESTVAFTPYAFIPAIPEGKQKGDNVEVTFTGTATITADDITATGENPHTVDKGEWSFHGTYKRIDWQECYGRWYGFNAADGVFSHCIDGAYFPGLRCYLVYDTPSTSRTVDGTSADAVPTTLEVVFNNGYGETTAIGTLDTRMGDITIDNDSWYSIDGRKLQGKPTMKGLYIHQGKKTVIR